MKKQTLGRVTVLSFLLMLAAVSLSAQSERTGAINIPFSFTVGEKTLPAGEYSFEPNRKDSDLVWLVQSRDGDVTALFTTTAVRATETQEKAKLVFHKYGDQYFLSQIWTQGETAGRELLIQGFERQLAKDAIERQMIVLASGPATRN